MITLDADVMTTWATEKGIDGASYTELVKSPEVNG